MDTWVIFISCLFEWLCLNISFQFFWALSQNCIQHWVPILCIRVQRRHGPSLPTVNSHLAFWLLFICWISPRKALGTHLWTRQSNVPAPMGLTVKGGNEAINRWADKIVQMRMQKDDFKLDGQDLLFSRWQLNRVLKNKKEPVTPAAADKAMRLGEEEHSGQRKCSYRTLRRDGFAMLKDISFTLIPSLLSFLLPG